MFTAYYSAIRETQVEYFVLQFFSGDGMTIRFVNRAFFFLVCVFLGNITYAAPPARTYDINVLIFSHLSPDTVQSEEWPFLSSETIASFYQNNQLTTTTIPSQGLQHEKNTLQNMPGYTVIFDQRWQRSWTADNTSITLPISGESNHSQIKGYITITLSHYFDVHTNLLLAEPTSLLEKMNGHEYFSQWSQPYFYFQFTQNRRMRSRELNYLSHPLMGVLIKMMPVKN